MAVDFPSDGWIDEWKAQLNDNDEYAEKASDWGVGWNGDFIFTIEVDDEAKEKFPELVGDNDKVQYFIGLEGGECTGAYQVDDLEDVDYGFEIIGPYENWKKLANGEIGAIDSLMSGQFELNGDMQRVMQYSDGAVEMVETATDIETNFVY
ncbi:SCP2 sterol-binding domain-containing protein [Haladaptatus sp. F3-133]|jgi:putative sterol carrier protein|uniref:SCP2 sterol-binding domain-containing protein n=1 Tax=Halorutilus salinus TaxID=2487751 RepID=A0A9Q4C3F5_9EURY|nr:SCP2 sterol-binding domain-containing protein [Halorutilus salinus]MCX2817749.1 SCP2 sterol-binding domain-containing protein [Halorutilus salinus]